MATPLMRQLSVLGAKIETSLGTVEAITNAEAAFKTYDANLKILGPLTARPAQVALGNDTGIPSTLSAELSFMSYLAGSGTSSLPTWAETFFPSCGMPVTVATYGTSDDQSTWKGITAAHYQNGRKKIARGFMGNWKMGFEAGKPVAINWDYKGGYSADPGAASILSGMSYDSAKPPRWDGSGSLTLDSQVYFKPSKVDIDLGNAVSLREDPNSPGGYLCGWIGNRLPKVTMDPEAIALGTYNWFTKHSTPTEVTMVLVVGTVSHNVITITCTNMQLENPPDDADRDGKLVDSLGFEVHGGITIAFT